MLGEVMMNGQTDAGFRDWATTSRAGLRRTAFLLCGDWSLADDLVQEALIRLYVAWPRLSRSESLRNYSRRVLINLYLDHRRRPSRREQPTDVPPDVAGVEAEEMQHRDLLLGALRQVPSGQRAVLVLRFWEDLSVNQTAELLDTSPGNVKSQTSRGLVTLRAAVAAAGLASELTSLE